MTLAKGHRFAELRACASCEWVFRAKEEHPECPKCGFGSYGARRVYGNSAYRYEQTQVPWKGNKLTQYKFELAREIEESIDALSKTTEELN